MYWKFVLQTDFVDKTMFSFNKIFLFFFIQVKINFSMIRICSQQNGDG